MLKHKRLAFSAGACCLIGVVSCSSPANTSAKTEAQPEKPASVAAVKVTRQDLSRDLVLSAEFRPYQEIEVHAKVAGYLKQILVDVGDRVKAGQTLALLEVPEMQDDATQAAATKRRSESELERARTELTRAESSHEAAHLSYQRMAQVVKTRPGLVAQQEVDDAQARDRVSEAQVSTAKAAISSAENQVAVSTSSAEHVRTMQAYTRITAPFDGVITKRYADLGSMIQAGTASQSQARPLVRLSQNDRLRLVLPVPESVVPRIRLGSVVEVRVQALGRKLEGRVSRFSGWVNAATRTMETEVDVPNPRLELFPGMYAEALIQLDQHHGVLAVPVQSISSIETHPEVFVVNAQRRVELRPVKVGIETPDKVEVVDGLHEGELVIVGKQAQIKAGQLVEPQVARAN